MEPVPADSLTLTMPLDSLLDLPQGAVYVKDSGRAHARVTVSRPEGKPAVVYVSAWCDSLARLVASYESSSLTSSSADMRTERAQNDIQTVSEHPPNTIRKLIISFIAGILTGAVTTIIIRRKT